MGGFCLVFCLFVCVFLGCDFDRIVTFDGTLF